MLQEDRPIGEILYGLRREHDVSQLTVANEIGVNQGTISDIEKQARQPRPKMIRRFATYFNTPLPCKVRGELFWVHPEKKEAK